MKLRTSSESTSNQMCFQSLTQAYSIAWIIAITSALRATVIGQKLFILIIIWLHEDGTTKLNCGFGPTIIQHNETQSVEKRKKKTKNTFTQIYFSGSYMHFARMLESDRIIYKIQWLGGRVKVD